VAKPKVSPEILAAIAKAKAAPAVPGKKEAKPKTTLTERESIRPARTSIAHQRGGNKGK
jgi:hypothetical protein